MIANISVAKPLDWQDFERKVRVLLACELKDPETRLNGRLGQPQAGVDVWGYRNRNPACLVGLQCKLSEYPPSPTNLRAELELAKTFNPPISEFILATTAPRDATLQEEARCLTVELEATARPIAVSTWGWQDIQSLVTQHAEAWEAFDPTYNPFAKRAHQDATRTYAALEVALAGIIQAVSPPQPPTSLDVGAYLAEMDAKLGKLIDETDLIPNADRAPLSRSVVSFAGKQTDSSDDPFNLATSTGRRCLLVAETGAGKTTFLRQYGRFLCRHGQEQLARGRDKEAIHLPIYIDLSLYHGDLTDFICSQALLLLGRPLPGSLSSYRFTLLADDFQKCTANADSDEVARSYRFHLARDSEMMSPTVPISNRPGDARLPAGRSSGIDDVVWSSFLGLL